MTTPCVSRRRFVEALAIVAGSVTATSLCPSSMQAAPHARRTSSLAAYATTGPLTDWTIDDMTAPYPRYAQAIGCSRSAAGLVHSDPLDYL